jgi:hypothetical protein
MGTSEERAKLIAELADVCRAKGIESLEMSSPPGALIKLHMGPPPPAPPKVLTPEEKELAEHERRRRMYEKQLGRKVSDEELAGLP